MLFDEPTEGLDKAGAQALISDVLVATGDRAVLIATHRIDWFENADEIFALDAGRLRPWNGRMPGVSAQLTGPRTLVTASSGVELHRPTG